MSFPVELKSTKTKNLGRGSLVMLNDIKILLDIQDKNILIEENSVNYGEYKGMKAKFIDARLTYTPTHCLKCNAVNEGTSIYKNGTQTSRITLPMMGLYPTFLRLKKQRFVCKTCGCSFTAKTSIVKKHCFISNSVKTQIVVKASEAQSIKNISRDCSVSDATVQRVINEVANKNKLYNQVLPEHLSFDEFKYAKSRMAFSYIDTNSGKILDILPSRDHFTIKNHFISRYSLSKMRKVKTVTIDMNAGYVSVIKELFPNAKIIIDRFHIVQLITRSMNKTRVKIMNQFKTSNSGDLKKYRRLKRYWKLLLKRESELSYTKYSYFRLFGQQTEASIIHEMLSYSDELEVNYRLYQKILKALDKRDYQMLKHILHTDISNEISAYIRTSIKTLKKHLPYIHNSLKYPYNNGRLEGIINKVKVLNRVSYGYRNFNHYKNRIILHFSFRSVDRKNKVNLKNKLRTTVA